MVYIVSPSLVANALEYWKNIEKHYGCNSSMCANKYYEENQRHHFEVGFYLTFQME